MTYKNRSYSTPSPKLNPGANMKSNNHVTPAAPGIDSKIKADKSVVGRNRYADVLRPAVGEQMNKPFRP